MSEGSSTSLQSQNDTAAFLEALLQSVPAFIVRADADMRLSFINMLQPGLELADVVGADLYEYIAPAYHEIAQSAIEEAQRTGETTRYEVEGMGPNGQPAYYESFVSPIPDADGRIGIVLAAFEQTEARKRIITLRENEAKLRVILRATQMGTWIWDFRTNEVEWDDRMKQIMGRTKSATLQEYVEFVHPDDAEEVLIAGTESVETGVWKAVLHRIVRPDGEVRWVLPTGTMLADEFGAPTRVLGGLLDITDQRKVEDQLRLAQKMEAVGQLTAGVAHNFNNLMMIITPALDMLKDVVPETHQSLLSDARHASGRAAELVRQLMTFVGQQNRKKRDRYELAEILDTAVNICRRTFDRRIKLENRVSAGLVVCVDAGEIEQVAMNLLMNARDALQSIDAPRIVIESVTKDDKVGFAVADNGAGMPDSVVSRVFEPFFTTKDAGAGSGLGLATCYAIVREHDGTIELKSSAETGTRVTVMLPLNPDADVPKEAAEEQEAPTQPGNAVVLVIEDEEAIRRVTERILVKVGYDVRLAANTDEARRLLSADDAPNVDVVLLDRSMPGTPGQMFVGALREWVPGAAILYFTGHHVTPSDLELVDGVIRKPAGPLDLRKAVANALAKRR